jgi:subfamily B ATP-binding cassette protein MsbA
MGTLYNSIGEVLSAQKIVKAYGAEAHEAERFRRINDDWTQARMKAIAIKTRTGPMVELAGACGLGLIVWFGGLRVINGTWNAAEFMAILLVLVKLIGSMRRLGMLNNRVQTGIASADRVSTVLFAKREIVDEPGADELTSVDGGIELRSVSFGYDPGQPVLHDISFQVPRGGSLAIVGPTGSGKSTISDLLPRFFDPEQGVVMISGRDIRDYTVESLRRNIAIVTQDTILFQDTIAANIAYARPETPMEKIIEAAKAAHAHDFIMATPDGYETFVGERGMTLSGGERQRVAIARALLRDAPILVLDEATSALDSKAEKVVQGAIDTLKHGRTTVTIAHRLSTIRDADQILVIAEGRIAERGTHAKLLAAGGLYAEMWNAQTQE